MVCLKNSDTHTHTHIFIGLHNSPVGYTETRELREAQGDRNLHMSRLYRVPRLTSEWLETQNNVVAWAAESDAWSFNDRRAVLCYREIKLQLLKFITCRLSIKDISITRGIAVKLNYHHFITFATLNRNHLEHYLQITGSANMIGL